MNWAEPQLLPESREVAAQTERSDIAIFDGHTIECIVANHIATSHTPCVVKVGHDLDERPWHMDEERVTWVQVTTPASATERDVMLPAHDRLVTITTDALLDPSWLDELRAFTAAPLIDLTGIVTGLSERNLARLLLTINDRIAGARVLIAADPAATPPPFSTFLFRDQLQSRRDSIPWRATYDELRLFISTLPSLTVESLWLQQPFGNHWFAKILRHLPGLKARSARSYMLLQTRRRASAARCSGACSDCPCSNRETQRQHRPIADARIGRMPSS